MNANVDVSILNIAHQQANPSMRLLR